jgi:phosphoglycolate phosphatase-like HAD superfamily hydrolase
MIKDFHIFDFDGTLADSSHRYRVGDNGKIDLQHWIANEHLALLDRPLPLLNTYRDLMLSRGHYPMIATARIWCHLSAQWVQEHGIAAHVVARLSRTDTRGGADLKITGVRRLLNLKQFSQVERVHVYEDNLDYLRDICDHFSGDYETVANFIPSNQGH